MIRPLLSLKRLFFDETTGKVRYQYSRHGSQEEWIKKNTEMNRGDASILKPKKPKEPHKSASFESFIKDLRKKRLA